MTRRITANWAGAAGLALSCALSACAQDAGHGGAFGFFYNDQGDRASLAYGAPNSDDVAVMFECAKGSGRVRITDMARPPAEPRLILASNGQSDALRAEAVAADGPAMVIADTSAASSPMLAFRRTGRLRLDAGGVGLALAARAPERVGVERFFKACA